MSRLQVGGLALIIYSKRDENIGRVVKLDGFLGKENTGAYGVRDDYWFISANNLAIASRGKNKRIVIPSAFLLPLGDKQTQDELRKEECEA